MTKEEFKKPVEDLEVGQDKDLPSWAKKKKENILFQSTDQLGDAQIKEDIFAKQNLPSWAIKGKEHIKFSDNSEKVRMDPNFLSLSTIFMILRNQIWLDS